MTVKMWITTLCIIFFLGIGVLFVTNSLISKRIFSDVSMPQITSALRQKYEYGVKSTVDVEAQNLANRLQGITDKKKLTPLSRS